MSSDAPCRHLAAEPVRCLLGRSAPNACGSACAAYDPAPPVTLDASERQRCEVWTRVMGYHRPVSAFNAGKQSEHRERVRFVEQSHD